eukprot:TRINITY_DN11195_c0_g1_i1.p1 TRINITY_DN11195_c0_g1~~TRINITY_DN11195_c0_g1_i1.p1  ORF type:complete len:458 (+),score=201.88 TRINITY_DN11195_c0_g1_i1:91-1464(+)
MNIEACRQVHEDIERNTEEIVEEITYGTRGSHRQKIIHEHFLNDTINAMREKKRKLIPYYEEQAKKPQEPLPLSTVENQFYADLADVREYHRKFPRLQYEEPPMNRPDPDRFSIRFSGEEGFGRYLDMHHLYNMFMLLPFNYETSDMKGKAGYDALVGLKVRSIDYYDWVKMCTMFHNLPTKSKNQQYKEYLEAMLKYLADFYSRAQPLAMDAADVIKEGDENFESRWGSDGVLGWEHVKPMTIPTDRKLTKKERVWVFQRSVARLEELVQRFYDMLGDYVQQTLAMLDRKETRSKEELDAEVEREEEEARKLYEARFGTTKEVTEKENVVPLQNAKNLPVGYDGAPIPFWLYRLHGLNMKYTCEICRGYTYVGPKAFDKHFQEARHAHGMQCLRIPNTRHFHHVTQINDAIALWKKIKTDALEKQWNADNEQEFEDSEGHVFNKKTRDDMRRQGLM